MRQRFRFRNTQKRHMLILAHPAVPRHLVTIFPRSISEAKRPNCYGHARIIMVAVVHGIVRNREGEDHLTFDIYIRQRQATGPCREMKYRKPTLEPTTKGSSIDRGWDECLDGRCTRFTNVHQLASVSSMSLALSLCACVKFYNLT